ncbi:MAG: adenylate/guanylate cyclase domain-containing protein, partial [Myxococcota bacterium]
DAALEAPGHAFEVEFARQGQLGTTQRQRVTLAYRAHPFWWLEPLTSSIFILTAAVFFFRVRDRGLALRSVGLLGASAIYLTGSFWGGGEASDLWSLYRTITVAALYFFTIRFALFFPYRRPAGRPIEWALPILFGASNLSQGLINRFPVAVLPEGVVSAVSTATGPLWATVILWSITYNYLHAKPSERRQIKWLLLGMYVTFVPWLFGVLVYVGLAEAGPWRPFAGSAADAMHLFQAVGTVLMAATPIGAMISVFYYRLIDVDPILSRASSVTIVGAGLLGFVLYVLPILTHELHDNTGFGEDNLRFALVAAVMVLAVPTNRMLRSRIDHFLRPDFNNTQKAFQDLLFSLGAIRDVKELTATYGREIKRIFSSSTLAVYAKSEGSFELIFGSGRGIPSTFSSAGPLVANLQRRKTPISLHQPGSQSGSEPLSAFDRATLETLGASVVVPVRQSDELPAFLCLGEKESGDIYLPQELGLLGVLANAVSAHLGRLDQQSVAETTANMRDDLKRYVPGAVARQIEAGTDLAPKESPVSILFVDIRGYSTRSEGLGIEAVFSMINAFTQAVSHAVENHGGCVTEFNGDGLMAVFGAP